MGFWQDTYIPVLCFCKWELELQGLYVFLFLLICVLWNFCLCHCNCFAIHCLWCYEHFLFYRSIIVLTMIIINALELLSWINKLYSEFYTVNILIAYSTGYFDTKLGLFYLLPLVELFRALFCNTREHTCRSL